jgi:hypothetical protein
LGQQYPKAVSKIAIRHTVSKTGIQKYSPVRVHVIVMRLADLKAKPDANHENAHPMQDWSCQICNQPRAPSPARRTGFKSGTTRTNLARMDITSFALIMAAILSSSFRGHIYGGILVC